MSLNLEKLFIMQQELDEVIKKNNKEQMDFTDKTMAFIVEMGEMMNEVRCFKKWSKKPASPKKIILDEFSDCTHFLLSLGNDLNSDLIKRCNYMPCAVNSNLKQEWIGIIMDVGNLNNYKLTGLCENIEKFYIRTLERFIALGMLLGFSWEEMQEGYYIKNKINHQRQKNNY